MGTYEVTVQKEMIARGTVTVQADSPDKAKDIVNRKIGNAAIRTVDVEWNDPEYVDYSFQVTDDEAESVFMNPDSEEWEALANQVARNFVSSIFPCVSCGLPVISGFCCSHCGEGDPCGEGGV